MADMNGYFQLYSENGVSGIRIFPSEGAGNRLELDEITSYLEKNSLRDYDIKEINNAINFANEPRDVKIYEHEISPIGEMTKVSISEISVALRLDFILREQEEVPYQKRK
jgi:hypothetical protein